MHMNYIIISIYFTCYFGSSANSLKEYGLLTITVNKFELCKGPKRRDCCVPAVRVNRNTELTYDLLIKEDFILTTGKVVGSSGNKDVLKFQMKKPCENFMLRTMFKMYLNITENCELSKGRYIFTANVQEVSEKYYGGKYFYGNWTIKSVFHGHDCNFFCTIMDISMIPRKKT